MDEPSRDAGSQSEPGGCWGKVSLYNDVMLNAKAALMVFAFITMDRIIYI